MSAVMDDLAAVLGVRRLVDINPKPREPLALDMLDMEGHTILYGDGGSGKGVIAADLAGRLGKRVLILDYEDHPGEWARRVRALGGDMDLIHHVSPLTVSWHGQRGPIWAQKEDIWELCGTFDIEYLVIDSIVPACGAGDSLKPEAPAQYMDALQFIGRPALSLATHEGERGPLPVGSVFWHHLARTTWSVTKLGGEGHRILLRHRKHNNHESMGKSLLTVDWLDNLPRNVHREGYTESLSRQIADLLACPEATPKDGPHGLTAARLADLLNEDLDDDEPRVKVDSVRHALRRGLNATRKAFTVSGTGKDARWSNA